MALLKPAAGTHELRAISETELRAEKAGDRYEITGYAAKFGVRSKPLPGDWVEVISPNAFDRSLAADAPVQCRFNHLPTMILGRTENGTLTLEVDNVGLRFRAQLNPKMQSHRDLFEAVKREDYCECSFGFIVPPGGDTWNGNVRTLKDVDLFDVSLVGDAQYPQTSASARAAQTGTSDIPTTAELRIKADQIQRNLDNEMCARVLKLGAEIRAADDGAEDDDPNDSESDQEEFNNALHDMSVASWDDAEGKLLHVKVWTNFVATASVATNATQSRLIVVRGE